MKKIILFISFSLFWITTVFAAGDCSDVEKYFSNYTFVSPLPSYYSDAAYKQALLNLQAYCCQMGEISVGVCDANQDLWADVYPESWFLYDHLVDVGLRVLDAENAYGVGMDPLGDAWRQYIVWVASSPDAQFALSIHQTFEQYWAANNTDYVPQFFAYTDIVNRDQNILLWLAVATNYTSANLYQKYNELCGIAVAVYGLRAINVDLNHNSQLEGAFNLCTQLVQQRVIDETLYTKSVIRKKSSEFLQKSISTYATQYFAKERLIHLQETIYVISDLFLAVAKMAPEGTARCN